MNAIGKVLMVMVVFVMVPVSAFCAEEGVVVMDDQWTLIEGEEGELVLSARTESFMAPGKDLIITAGKLSLGQTSNSYSIVGGNPVTIAKLNKLFPDYPVRIAAARSRDAKSILVVLEQQGGARVFNIGWVPDGQMANQRTADAGAMQEKREDLAWKTVTTVTLSDNAFFLSDLTSPTVAPMGEEMFVAGESNYPQKEERRAIWIASEKSLKGRELSGVMLGEGHSPCLVSWDGKLICLAVRPVRWRSATTDYASGHVVGWISEDGKTWAEWDPGIVEQNIVRISARSWRNFGIVMVSQTANEVRSYEMRAGSQRFEEDGIMVPNEGMAARALCIAAKVNSGVRILSRDNRNRSRMVALERRSITSKEQEKK